MAAYQKRFTVYAFTLNSEYNQMFYLCMASVPFYSYLQCPCQGVEHHGVFMPLGLLG